MTEGESSNLSLILSAPMKYSVETYPIPVPEENEVLVEVKAAPINPSDLGLIYGFYPTTRKYPFGAGLEGCGRIIKSGGGKVADSFVGKKVAFFGGDQLLGSYSRYTKLSVFQCAELD